MKIDSEAITLKSKSNKESVLSRRRIEWVDVAKGIAIILVCLGHRKQGLGGVLRWLYSFHLPLFFFLSGYTTRYVSYGSFRGFLYKKGKGIVLPYFAISLAYLPVQFLYEVIYRKESFQWLHSVRAVLNGGGLGATWFMTALFITNLFGYLIYKLPSFKHSLTLTIVGIGFLLNRLLDRQLIWNINTAMIGLCFFQAGQWLQNDKDRRSFFCKQQVSIFLISASINILIVLLNDRFDMVERRYGNEILFLMAAFSGISAACIGSIWISKTTRIKRILTYLGNNTIPIMVFHIPWGYIVIETFYYKAFGLTYGKNIFSSNIEPYIYSISPFDTGSSL